MSNNPFHDIPTLESVQDIHAYRVNMTFKVSGHVRKRITRVNKELKQSGAAPINWSKFVTECLDRFLNQNFNDI